MSFIKVDTKANPIPASTLAPKAFAWPSGGGGGGGGGGPVQFYIGGADADSFENGGTPHYGAGETKTYTAFNKTYRGSAQAMGFLQIGGCTIDPWVSPTPKSHRVAGNVTVTITWLTGKTQTYVFGPEQLFNIFKLFVGHTDPATDFPVQISVTNNLAWYSSDDDSTTPAGALIGETALTIMEV